MKKSFTITASLVESVRDLSELGAYSGKGRMSINEAITLVADKYKISTNPVDYEFIVLKALHAEVPNNNGDAFPLEELKRFSTEYNCRVYQTFILKPHFIEHKQDGEVYGFVLDAHLEEPKDDPAYVELVLAVDTTKDPFYGARIKSGKVGKYSMGCTVGYTICEVCQHKAVSHDDFCDHIRNHKMESFKVGDESGDEKEIVAFEKCYEVVYDEISDVADPADPDALEEERLKAASTHKKFATNNNWEKAGFTEKETEQWKSAGFDNPDDAISWRKLGFDAETSMSWKDNGFKRASEANRWLLAGFKRPVVAGKWKKAGWKNPLKAVVWKDARYKPDEAFKLFKAGRKPEVLAGETGAPAPIPARPSKIPRDKKQRTISDMEYPKRLRGLPGSRVKAQYPTTPAPGGPAPTPGVPMGQEKEKGWLINLSDDIQAGKIRDEYGARDWFKQKYNRDPNPGEQENMRSLFSKEDEMTAQKKQPLNVKAKSKLLQARDALKKLGDNANYFLWTSRLRRLGFSKEEIKAVEQEGVSKGLWKIEDIKPVADKPEGKKPARRRPTGKRPSREPRTYVVKSVSKSATDVKFPSMKDWKLTVKDFGRRLIAELGNDKEVPFKKVLSKVNEQKFAESVLKDLLKFGLSFVVKKYGFTPRFKAITDDGISAKAPGTVTPREDRITSDGDTDKEGFDGDKNVNKSITDEGALDKEGKKKRPLTLATRKRPITVRSKKRPLTLVSDKKKKRTYGAEHLDVARLVRAVVAFCIKYKKFDSVTAQRAIAKHFLLSGGDKKKLSSIRVKAQEPEAEVFETAVEENVEVVDVPGLVEEVVEYLVEDEEMAPADVAVEFVEEFVSPEAPDEVKDEIKEEVVEKAEEVEQEKAEPGEEVPGPEDVGKVREEVEELAEETPSMDEMGIEDLEVESSKKAEEMNEQYKLKLLRALKVAATRQLLNVESEGLFDIKMAVCDYLIQPQGKFAGIKPDIAAGIINQAFNSVLEEDYLDKLFASASKLVEMPDEAFVQIEADSKNLKPVDIVAVKSEGKDKKQTSIFAKTGTDLLKDEEALNKSVRAAIGQFNDADLEAVRRMKTR